jgi:acetyl-CoA synthetase (ADP-forming)
MLKSIETSPLYTIVNPKSIAIFGASNNINVMGTNQLLSILSRGYEGKIYPVHPKENKVQNLKAYRTVTDLPEVPDLALMVLPTGIVPQMLEECGRKGITHAIIVSGGFKEVGGKGVDLESKLIEIADRYGIRFLGPNCIGVANPHQKLNVTFLEDNSQPGFIGMVSQSGSFITQMFDYLSNLGLGFSTGISVGNEANIDLVDCIQYLALCPNTKVIALYIESIRRGSEFIKTARSIVPNKPIVAFYVGGSEAGKRASFSHTGALAGPDRLYDGVFRQSGVIRANSIGELFDFCWVLGTCPRPDGNRVIVQTHSGGPGAAAADACSRVGLELPPLSKEVRKKLAEFVPPTASVNNPVDLTFSKNPLDYFAKIPQVLLAEPSADGLLIYYLMPTQTIIRALKSMGSSTDKMPAKIEKITEDVCHSVVSLFQNQSKPFIGFSFRTHNELFIRKLQDKGIPVLAGPERAARAMHALVQYTRLREKIRVGGGNSLA